MAKKKPVKQRLQFELAGNTYVTDAVALMQVNYGPGEDGMMVLTSHDATTGKELTFEQQYAVWCGMASFLRDNPEYHRLNRGASDLLDEAAEYLGEHDVGMVQ